MYMYRQSPAHLLQQGLLEGVPLLQHPLSVVDRLVLRDGLEYLEVLPLVGLLLLAQLTLPLLQPLLPLGIGEAGVVV